MDGNRAPRFAGFTGTVRAIVGGDRLCTDISAASILAKVARDEEMRQLHESFPQYGFARHKGYPTADHREALARFGPCPAHRRSFRPVRRALPQGGQPDDGAFVHLHVHSEYSLADSVVRIPELLAAARAGNMPAVALTDQAQSVCHGHFLQGGAGGRHQADHRRRGLGATGQDDGAPGRLVLLCRNAEGYANLARLVSRSYLEGQEAGLPVVHRRWLADGGARGLIALSGGRDGLLAPALAAGRMDEAGERCCASSANCSAAIFTSSWSVRAEPARRSMLANAVRLAAATGCPGGGHQ